MFERLAGKLLSRLLSKYFVSDNTGSGVSNGGGSPSASGKASSPSSSWSNLGVWSGYVSLENLELRKEVVNSYLKSKGLPFELLQCTLGRVEITVPWAKLGLSSPSGRGDGEDAVVVVVVDGVHAILRTNYEFDDEALREAAIQERRQELNDAQVFSKVASADDGTTSFSSGLSGFLQKRLAEGILKDVLEKLHIHIRDVHVRLEDIQSDPLNPCAVGVTFESLHVHADENVVEKVVSPTKEEVPPPSGVIRKVAQLNHFSIYWNALAYGEGVPAELSVLQDTMESPAALAAALERCITRRATSLSSPLRDRPAQTTPNNSFLLLPLDASWYTKLSTDPRNLEERPALETSLHIDDLSLQLRDFQCSQMSILAATVKEHSFSKDYRKYRPSVSAKEDPRAWWKYAFRIIKLELRKGNMRWSWSRFSKRYALRKRYCELYERERRYQIARETPSGPTRRKSLASSLAPSTMSLPSQDSVSDFSSIMPCESADSSAHISNGGEEATELNNDEMDELTAMEDGTRGDLSVHDILLFRALVNARVAANRTTKTPPSKSRLRRLMSSFISDDIESEEEYERLLSYLEQARDTQESLVSQERASSLAVSIHISLDRGCISLFTPLRSTEDLDQHRRIQQRFLDLRIMRLHVGYSLYGNYESTQLQVSLEDFVGSEIRRNHSVYTIISRTSVDVGDQEQLENGSGYGTPKRSNVHSAKQDLATFELQGSPLDTSDCDIRMNASLQELEVILLPDGEWLHKIKKLTSSKPTTQSLSSFWNDIGMAQINAISSRRAGLRAKVNTVIFARKNVDMDILIRCPLLRISGGRETTITIDLGNAHFVTDRLAGIATGKLLVSKMKGQCIVPPPSSHQNGDGRQTPPESGTSVGGSTDSSAKMTPKMNGSDHGSSSPRRELGESFFLGGSAMSIIEGGNRMSTRSFYGNAPFADGQGSDDFPTRVNRGLQSSFYDEFRLEISNTSVNISGGEASKQSSLVDSFDVEVSISKSVIPSDHTLCRLRMQCVIHDITLRLSESSISYIADLARSWANAMNTEVADTSYYMPSVSRRDGRVSARLGLPLFRDTDDHDLRDTFSDASSMLDEAEFIDAMEGDDAGDDAGDWFDDNWIADAESVVDSDIRSVSSKRKRNRRSMSVSEVSSISEGSLGTRQMQTQNKYLSAENLARLEELVAEEEDDGDSGSVADSFQSALSLGGQAALAAEVEEHIRRAKDEVNELKRSLASEAKCSDGSPFLIPEARRRSQVRKGLRVDLDRANAELRALRATHEDLLAQLEDSEALHYDEQLDAEEVVAVDEGHEANGAPGSGVNARAMALVRARKQRSMSNADEAFKHQLTSGLNRELVRASVVVTKVTVVLEEVGSRPPESETKLASPLSSFEFYICQCAVGVLLRANESKLSANIDGIVASMIDGVSAEGVKQSQHLLLGGSSPLILDSSREGYNVPITAAEDRFLVFTLERQEKPILGGPLHRTAQATKLRIRVGEVDFVPREESVLLLSSFLKNAKSKLSVSNTRKIVAPPDNKESSTYLHRLCCKLNGDDACDRIDNESEANKVEYTDISFHLSSLRVTLASGDNTVGSFLLTDAGVRFLRGVTGAVYTNRSQLDVRLNNIQLFDLYHRPSGLELLGCRDPYNPIAQMRIRSQLAPFTQTGGWVVGDNSTSGHENVGFDDLAWNMHVGAKLTSVFVTLSPDALKRISHSAQQLKKVVSSTGVDNAKGRGHQKFESKLDADAPESPATNTVQENSPLLPASAEGDTQIVVPIRWRGDFVAKKVSVLFPGTGDISEIDISQPHLARSNALLSFSLHSLMQAAPRTIETVYLRSVLSDVSLIRTSDDWPLLESTSVTAEIILPQRKVVNASCQLRLCVPETCTWNGHRGSSVGAQNDCMKEETNAFSHPTAMSISISPLRFNIAPQTGSLLLAVAEGVKQFSEKDKTRKSLSNEQGESLPSNSSPSVLQESGRSMKLSIESVEVKLLRESERSTSISFADSLASLVALKLVGSASQDADRDEATIKMGDLCLYDLSTLPGARVFGREEENGEILGSDDCADDDDPEADPQIMLAHFTRSSGESPSANLDTRLGKMQCLVLPSFLRSLLSFKSSIGELAANYNKVADDEDTVYQFESQKSEIISVPLGVQQLDFSLRVVGFECLLPSRDLFAYIRSRSKEPVNVVAFRWKSVLTGTLSSTFQGTTEHGSMLDSLALTNGQSQEVGCLMARANLRVEDFQVLRTNVTRRPFPRSAAGGPHISPCTFVVHPPIAGEQRITNPFWFNVTYLFALAADRANVSAETENRNKTSNTVGAHHVSQALEVEAGFVDVLVYIKQSAGGMNDALRVTIKPIVDMLKRKEEAEVNLDKQPQSSAGPSKLSDSLKSATTVCSLHSEGIQATCVPGGATRLTESPIAKCKLSNMKLGLVTTALPVDPKVAFGSTSHSSSAIERLRQAGLERFGVVEPTISGGPVSHTTVGAWMQTELSASYHNRRLVAWEPFIEPWILNVRSGIDLVRAFKLAPLPWPGETEMKSQSGGFMSSIVGEGINEKTGDKIRDIGRLLRAPFSPGASVGKPAGDLLGEPTEMSSFNLSYVMMKSIAPKIVASALYPTDRTWNAYSPLDVQVQTSSLQCLPGTDPAKWLELFGYPSIASRGAKRESAAVVCAISDSCPLNLNLTGALIESVLGFLGGGNKESIHPTVPHTIRNLTGLTLRFQESLDTEQTDRGELAKKTIVSTGSEIPLSLKRTLSQRCDPHRAYIFLELGSFEDTAGRIDHQDFEVSSRSRSTTFFYKAMGKIPVDTVGVRRYALCHQYKRRRDNGSEALDVSQDIGYIIVRVNLQGSTKVVSIESPFVLKNNTEVDLLCELRNHGGVSLLWRSLIPRSMVPMPSEKIKMVKRRYISLPADLVPTASSAEATLSVRALPPNSTIKHESEVPQEFGDHLVAVELPPPFSDKSVARGLIKVFETNLNSVTAGYDKISMPVSLNTCGVRIGSVSLRYLPEPPSESTGIAKQAIVPEQRMLFFRPPIIIRNHLPVTIAVEGRVKKTVGVLRRTSSTAMSIADRINRGEVVSDRQSDSHDPSSDPEWNNLGILECGKSLSWTGATAKDSVEIRVRMSNKLGEASRKFPEWSSSTVIPAEAAVERLKKPGIAHTVSIGQMAVLDDTNVRLQLSASLEFGSSDPDTTSKPRQDICWFSRTLPAAPRVVGVFVPFWIIDSTGEDLEFSSNAAVAGQSSRYSKDVLSQDPWPSGNGQDSQEHLGLAALLDDEKLSILSARTSFEVLMIGEKKSSRLAIRRRMTRLYDGVTGSASSWCEPVALKVRDNTFNEVFVPAPLVRSRSGSRGIVEDLEPLALGARILDAPEEFGGLHGTMLVHVSCRYRIVNEMGRDIEVLSDYGKGIPSTIRADSPAPFHFDGTSPIRFRPKEFGWGWSGRFSIRKKRKEVTLRLVHKLKGQVIIAEIEFVQAGNSGGITLIFREASHPPFRLENQTMHAIHFCQSSVLFGAERGQMSVSLDSTILPYHHADFAWDEPDERRRYLAIEVADLGKSARRYLIGRFKLDRAAPGTQVRLSDSNYFGQIVAEGPTRVFRITDSSLPPLPSNEVATRASNDVFKKPEYLSGPPSVVELKLTHGLGISVIDWSPQELLYIQLDEISAERRVDAEQENLDFNISCVSVDNQIWVTPFPVLMRMGRRTRSEKVRRRRRNAVAVSWRRALNTQSGLIMMDTFELSTEPVILNVDGHLSERIWEMMRQAVGMRDLIGGTQVNTGSRDTKLQQVLKITEDRHADVSSSINQGYRGSYGNEYEDEAFLATAVVAAKLRLRPRSESISANRASQAAASNLADRQSSLPKQRNKYYVGKCKISMVQTEISWTGPLPSALIKFPDIIRPALTFEALPVMMRPFSISHAYGTADDLAHDLKSHYLSIWRVFDFLVGLTFRPTFLIRACIYTWRESCASAFDSFSNSLVGIEKGLIRLSEPKPTASLSDEQLAVTIYVSQAYRTVIGGSLVATASVFRNYARLTSAISNALRYGGSAHNPASRSVRARNPRLFAHVEGNDLLVEYVEGENAGKAILSRVRMGRHLGEGHVFHCEDVHLQTTPAESVQEPDLDSPPLICMVTSERVFLLNGNRQADFCSVVWETTFLNLVEVEFDEFHDSPADLVKLWYLVDTAHAKGNTDDTLTRYAKTMVGDTDYGLDILLCKSIFVPKEIGSILRSKIAAVHRRLDESSSESQRI